jgi:hypothetical protein
LKNATPQTIIISTQQIKKMSEISTFGCQYQGGLGFRDCPKLMHWFFDRLKFGNFL